MWGRGRGPARGFTAAVLCWVFTKGQRIKQLEVGVRR